MRSIGLYSCSTSWLSSLPLSCEHCCTNLFNVMSRKPTSLLNFFLNCVKKSETVSSQPASLSDSPLLAGFLPEPPSGQPSRRCGSRSHGVTLQSSFRVTTLQFHRVFTPQLLVSTVDHRDGTVPRNGGREV